jgi:hypothetical protein
LNGEPVPGLTQPAVSLYPETRIRLLFWLQTLPALPYNVKLLTVDCFYTEDKDQNIFIGHLQGTVKRPKFGNGP